MPVQIKLTSLANRFLENNPSKKEIVENALNEIAEDPFVDAEKKFFFSIPPSIVSLYVNDGLWIIYRLNDLCTHVSIWNIGIQGERITL